MEFTEVKISFLVDSACFGENRGKLSLPESFPPKLCQKTCVTSLLSRSVLSPQVLYRSVFCFASALQWKLKRMIQLKNS